ncbi:MAG: hypothetical protein ACYDCL_19295 [Myxococcales bacterium]
MRLGDFRMALLAAGLCLTPACMVTTEADAVPEEQRAYARCVDGCLAEPSERTDDPVGPDQQRLCRQDCAASYPQDEAPAGAARSPRYGSLEGPETGGRDPTGVTIDTPPPPPPTPTTANE